ncbi:TonB-dependent receptor domain-containing protein [Sphingomonas sp. TF3]|uniref:TonB-dependent receptor domain-containing protein n=1 Tax=Sphingomonas sp. TF3 TaxID=2495580 RepID=UPI000F86BA1C|nr:TonB-dependent receptor [Sphingomonas sp. TF3]
MTAFRQNHQATKKETYPEGEDIMKTTIAKPATRARLLATTTLVAQLAWAGAAMAQSGAPSVQTPKTPAAVPAPSQTAPTSPATSAADSGTVMGDIIVTAQRREQLALKTPLSLTALDSALIERKQVTGLADLTFVAPGVRSGQQQGVNRIFIRGIGLSSFASGADSSIAFYVDGVYVGRPTEQLSSFYDISRLEVLRGPQGALYGRNATGGAVNLITNDPTREAGGYLDLSVGNYKLVQAEGAVNLPLDGSGDLRARLAFKVVKRDGYGYDYGANHQINDANSQAARLTVQYNPNKDVDIKLVGQYGHELDDNNYAASFGAYPGFVLQGVSDFGGNTIKNSQDISTGVQSPANRREGYALTLNAKFYLTDRLSLNSITGWRQFYRRNIASSDLTSAGLGITDYTERSHQISQELILNYDLSALQITAGVSYYHEKVSNLTQVPFIQFAGLLYQQQGTLGIDSLAGYLQGTYSITPHLRATVAGRYSTERRTSVGAFSFGTVTPIDDAHRWSAFTPKFGVEYDLTSKILVYASATNGFKSGTYNVGQVNPAINPEKIWAYEAGIKSRLLDNKLDVTIAAFHYDYSDLQVNKILGLATLTTNAAAAKISGGEISANARITRQFTIDANFTYLDSKFSSFMSVNPLTPTAAAINLNGNPLPGSPKYSATLGAQYVVHLPGTFQLTLGADAAYQSRIYFSEFKDDVISQKAVTKINASAKLAVTDDLSLTVWGKNVTNKLVAGNKILGIPLWGYPIYGNIEPPATYGVTLAARF